MRRSPRSPACALSRWRCPARSPSTGTGSPTPPSGPPWTRPATPSSGPEQVVSVTTERGTGTAVPGQPPGPRSAAIDLAVTGMTCSSCSARIAKRLNRLDGVSATVNFATETAAVRYDPARLGPEDIVATIEATGYGVRRPEPPEPDGAGADGVDPAAAEHDAAVASLRQRLTVSTVLTLPVLALAMIAPLQFDNWQWLSLTLASPVVIWGGWPFHRAALANLRHRAATMDTLVSMGTLAAYLWSLYALFLGDAGMPGMRMRFAVAASRGSGTGEIYLEVASAVTVFLLAGRFFEARAKRRSGAALRALLQLGAKDVCVLRGDTEQRVPVGRLRAVFVPVVILLALATLVVTLAVGLSAAHAFTAAVAVLIIACPCALGLATPTALLVGTGRGAQLGMLIRGPEVLESTRRVDTIVLDKTGTVTIGKMTYRGTVAAAGEDPAEVLRLAGALEAASEHPIAQVIATAAREQAGPLPAVSDFANTPGRGVRGVVDAHAVLAGRPAMLTAEAMPVPAGLVQRLAAAEADGQTVVAVGWDGRARGLVAVSDVAKPSSAAAIASLRALGLSPVLLTGDNTRAAQAVATTVGIAADDVIADVLPTEKVDVIRRLQAQGKVVAT